MRLISVIQRSYLLVSDPSSDSAATLTPLLSWWCDRTRTVSGLRWNILELSGPIMQKRSPLTDVGPLG